MSYWLFGLHAVNAALKNPQRRCLRLYHTSKIKSEIPALAEKRRVAVQIADNAVFARILPAGSVHQGVALQVEALPVPTLEELATAERATVLVLDQVTDPHNVGAILRSAAAFGASAVIGQTRHAAEESGVLAKAASGAVELVPYVTVVNISRTLDELKELGFWCLGLASEVKGDIRQLPTFPKKALVLGAEGSGLRPLVAKHCDTLVRLPTEEAFPSLNVSNAAAIALYQVQRVQG
jgi:23S rRNA (guanosine2251-2'-O)-methyltransferase